MTASPRTRRRPRGDDGLGLPELLVAMSVFGVVVSSLAAVLVATTQTVRTATVRAGTTADARIAMEAMTRTLRVAVAPRGHPAALVSAASDGVQLHASLVRDGARSAARPTLVSYAWDSATSCLVEEQVVASANPGADAATRPLVWTAAPTRRCLARTTSAPTFEYFTSGGLAAADGGAAVPLDTSAGPVPPASLPTVVSVQVTLQVSDPGASDVRGIAVRDRVTLVNALSTPAGG